MDTSILKLHHFKDTLTTNPHDRSFSQRLLGIDRDEWLELRNKTLDHINSLLIEEEGVKYLPEGTLLYHGSLMYPFTEGSQSTGNKNVITFFGLDTNIALWYILGLIEILKYKNIEEFNRFGYLYVFRLTKKLPVTKIIKTIQENPKDTLNCTMFKESVCIGPQISFRGQSYDTRYLPDIYNLSIELTMLYSYYKDHLELESVYLVDPLALIINRDDADFDPRMAIVQKIDEYKDEYDQKIDVETFGRYYRNEDDNFDCKYDCGFKGTFHDVLEHEKTCSKRVQKGSGLKKQRSGLKKRKNTQNKKKMKKNKYTRLIQQKQNGKLTKKKSKWLDKRLQNKLCKCIKGLKSSKKKKRYKKGSEYPICLSSIYTKRGFKPPKLAIKSCKKK